jgi:hypothetical protein
MVFPIKPISDLRFQMAKKARRARVSKVGSPVRRESVMNSRSSEPAPACHFSTSESAGVPSPEKEIKLVAVRDMCGLREGERERETERSSPALQVSALSPFPLLPPRRPFCKCIRA